MDKGFLDDATRARAGGERCESGSPFSEQRIDYILRTGANWAGPIRDFRLIVDKGDAGSLVSFCGEGRQAREPDPLRDAGDRLHAGARPLDPDPQAAAEAVGFPCHIAATTAAITTIIAHTSATQAGQPACSQARPARNAPKLPPV